MVRVKRWKLWAVTGVAACAIAASTVIRVVAAEARTSKNAVRSSGKRNVRQDPDSNPCVSVNVQYVATGASGPAGDPVVLRKVSAHQYDLMRGGQKLGEIHVQAGTQTAAGVKTQHERAAAEAAEAKARLEAEIRARDADILTKHRLQTTALKTSDPLAAKRKAETAADAALAAKLEAEAKARGK